MYSKIELSAGNHHKLTVIIDDSWVKILKPDGKAIFIRQPLLNGLWNDQSHLKIRDCVNALEDALLDAVLEAIEDSDKNGG